MLVVISIACNDQNNGNFIGRCSSIEYGRDQDMELQYRDIRGIRVSYLGDNKIRISRRVFTFEREKEWFGNWCWNGLWMKPKEARRLLRYLKDTKRWMCEAAPVRLYEWFNRQPHTDEGKQ